MTRDDRVVKGIVGIKALGIVDIPSKLFTHLLLTQITNLTMQLTQMIGVQAIFGLVTLFALVPRVSLALAMRKCIIRHNFRCNTESCGDLLPARVQASANGSTIHNGSPSGNGSHGISCNDLQELLKNVTAVNNIHQSHNHSAMHNTTGFNFTHHDGTPGNSSDVIHTPCGNMTMKQFEQLMETSLNMTHVGNHTKTRVNTSTDANNNGRHISSSHLHFLFPENNAMFSIVAPAPPRTSYASKYASLLS